ncbi:hypothetical protein Pla100_59830 [Neorhodopirellula pilleata]|uniref:Uncharacterized protein n=2 Tax=Neorhodopirellula pilleata TaxID=2714738 RepID=A0A5C5ZI32_9BACT|nr:hypothetical protein Pla100_59830 [Neorhodopirellula pilleata]
MPLKRLWNSLCGRSSETQTAAKPSVDAAPAEKAATKPLAGAVPKPAKASAPATVTSSKPAATSSKPAGEQPRRSVLSMLSRGEHDGLIKTIRQHNPTSILEIGVGDGSRMTAILTALAPAPQNNATESGASPIKAAVIDQFELGSGKVALRDYHRQLNGLSQRPVIFPEPIGRGLVSVANRLGKMDVVLIDASVFASDQTQLANELQSTIGKVLHASSVVLSNESGKWSVRTFETNQAQRRAA